MTGESTPQDPSNQAWDELALAIGDFRPHAGSTIRVRQVVPVFEGPEGAAPLRASVYVREVNGSISDQTPTSAFAELSLPSHAIGNQAMKAAVAARVVELAAILPAKEVAWLQAAQELANDGDGDGNRVNASRAVELLDGPYPLRDQTIFKLTRHLGDNGRIHVRHTYRNQAWLDSLATEIRPSINNDDVTLREPDANGARVYQYRYFVDGRRQLRITDPHAQKEAGTRPDSRPTEEKVQALTAALRYVLRVL
jgi:hypothetical protein